MENLGKSSFFTHSRNGLKYSFHVFLPLLPWCLSPSESMPTATPAAESASGTPASSSASVPPHTVAIDEEPFDSSTSEVSLDRGGEVYSNRVVGEQEEKKKTL